MAGHSTDDYLETIYFLAFPIGEYTPLSGTLPLASRVAEMLGVSRASAGEMLKRLEADGLIERGSRKEALLTESGRARAPSRSRRPPSPPRPGRGPRQALCTLSTPLVVPCPIFQSTGMLQPRRGDRADGRVLRRS